MVSMPVSIGAGVAFGSVQLAVTRYYITNPAWNTFGNIVLGGVALAITQFTDLIKGADTKTAVITYGFTTLIGGLMNGIMPIALRLIPGNGRLGVSPLTGNVAAVPLAEGGTTDGYYSPTYYPDFSGSFYRRPQSRAAGFASDVTINPMAAIATQIPYNKILA